MDWKIKVSVTAYGSFLVTKKKSDTLWAGPNNDKKLGILDYNKTIEITGYEKVF